MPNALAFNLFDFKFLDEVVKKHPNIHIAYAEDAHYSHISAPHLMRKGRFKF